LKDKLKSRGVEDLLETISKEVEREGKASKIACFKMQRRGRDAIPVLEIRKWTLDKQSGPWQVYLH
jgi:hypothetical protein